MADFFDYLTWRGDLTFEESSLTDVDALIFCQLAYLNFKGIISENFDKRISLNEVASIFARDLENGRGNLGLVINKKTIDLLFECAKTKRFCNIDLCGYVDSYSQALEEQFSALTFVENKNTAFVAFRGTDDTIVGWKEDFNLAFKTIVPAQADSLLYLMEAKQRVKCKSFYSGGHSKGGNLAIFSAAHLPKSLKKKISAVYNFDGPGFLRCELCKGEFKEILSRTRSFFPNGSIIGMLFEHDSHYTTVLSNGTFIMQHDPFTWEILGPNFTECEELDKASLFFNLTFNEWFISLEESKRAEFVETLFSVLEATNAQTNSELAENWIKSAGAILKALAGLDKDIRKSAIETFGSFFKLAKDGIPSLIRNSDSNKKDLEIE